jgi:hypothetical protein
MRLVWNDTLGRLAPSSASKSGQRSNDFDQRHLNLGDLCRGAKYLVDSIRDFEGLDQLFGHNHFLSIYADKDKDV